MELVELRESWFRDLGYQKMSLETFSFSQKRLSRHQGLFLREWDFWLEYLVNRKAYVVAEPEILMKGFKNIANTPQMGSKLWCKSFFELLGREDSKFIYVQIRLVIFPISSI